MRGLRIWTSLLAGLSLVAAEPAAAEAFPTKPVRIVVPYSAGGGADLLARAVAERLSANWGQPVIVENKPGAGAIIGTDFVARASPDGYTLLLTSDASITSNPYVYAKLPYDPLKDLAPVTGLVSTPQMVIANASLPVNSLTELMALAKSKPELLNYSSYGTGSGPNLVFEGIATQTGAHFTQVPYQGIAPAIQAVIAGYTQLTLAGDFARPYIKDGKVKALATTGNTRDPAMPDVPTLAELGLGASDPRPWFGLFTSPGTPRVTIQAIQSAVAVIFAEPSFKERWVVSRGWRSMIATPDEFAAAVREDLAYKAQLIKNAGIKPQ